MPFWLYCSRVYLASALIDGSAAAAVTPEGLPGLEPRDPSPGLNVLLVDGARARAEKDAASLTRMGAAAEWVSAVDAADLGTSSRELTAGWWARQVGRLTTNLTDRS